MATNEKAFYESQEGLASGRLSNLKLHGGIKKKNCEVLGKLLETNQHCVQLTLSYYERPSPDEDVCALFEALNVNKSVQSVVVEYSLLLPKELLCLCEAVGRSEYLKELSFIGCLMVGHGDSLCGALREGLGSSSSLSELKFVLCKLDQDCLRGVCEGLKLNKSVISLELAQMICGDDMDVVSEMLTVNETIRSLNVTKWEHATANGMERFFEAVTINRSLQQIDHLGTFFGSEGSQCIGKMLTKNCTLKELLLSCCNFGNRGPGFGYVMEGLRKNKGLEKLNMTSTDIRVTDMPLLVKALRDNSTLTNLEMRDNMLQSESGVLLGEALRWNCGLKSGCVVV